MMSAKEEKDFEIEIKKDEQEYLDEISEFEAEDIGMVLDYFSGPFFVDSLGNSVDTLYSGVKERILIVLDNIELHLMTLEVNVVQQEQLHRLNALRIKIDSVGSM
jgi:hypothetical protein